jgi:CTP synthase (UTP-ammonia lyase)
MVQTVRIGLVGDFSDEVRAHRAIPRAFELVTMEVGTPNVALTWLSTAELGIRRVAALSEDFDGLWCVPGSPYASMDGALAAIRHARETGLPYLGTCAGFQHALIEVVRDVMNAPQADHAESNPGGELLLIDRLSCSLMGVQGRLRLVPGSRLAAIYGALDITEAYHCNYGLNPKHRSLLASSPLRMVAHDEEGDVRAVELPAHPFFIATLYQPELSALAEQVHPIVRAFADAAAAVARERSGAVAGKGGS